VDVTSIHWKAPAIHTDWRSETCRSSRGGLRWNDGDPQPCAMLAPAVEHAGSLRTILVSCWELAKEGVPGREPPSLHVETHLLPLSEERRRR
jgi:hypothetical protein